MMPENDLQVWAGLQHGMPMMEMEAGTALQGSAGEAAAQETGGGPSAEREPHMQVVAILVCHHQQGPEGLRILDLHGARCVQHGEPAGIHNEVATGGDVVSRQREDLDTTAGAWALKTAQNNSNACTAQDQQSMYCCSLHHAQPARSQQ